MINKLNHKAIAGMYHADKKHRAVLNTIAAMPRQSETLVDTLENRLTDERGLAHRDIVDTLKALDQFGAGEFIPGRRGHPSRFKWNVDSIHISSIDEAFPNDGEAPLSGFDEQLPGALIKHRYQLRPHMTVSLELPTDLTIAEVHKLYLFLQSLPFFQEAPAALSKVAGASH